jgi:hypothetical protein
MSEEGKEKKDELMKAAEATKLEAEITEVEGALEVMEGVE